MSSESQPDFSHLYVTELNSTQVKFIEKQ